MHEMLTKMILMAHFLTDFRETMYDNQGEEVDDDSRVSPHLHTHACFCPFCCPPSHRLFCWALKEAPCLRGTLECVESSWSQKTHTYWVTIVNAFISEQIVRVYHKYSCKCSTDFSALYGMPDIFAASGLDTPNTAVDDGKLLCQVTIGLGAGYDCNGVIIQSQWILSDACCVYNLWATNIPKMFLKVF